MIMSSSSKSSLRVKVHLLKVHPRNITMVVCRRHLMSSFGEFQWSLSIHKWKSNILSPQAKVLVESWWFLETRVNSNQKEMVRRILGPHVYDKKSMDYLMETQVNLTTYFFWIVFWFFSQKCYCPQFQKILCYMFQHNFLLDFLFGV